jgi:hypothetical protein
LAGADATTGAALADPTAVGVADCAIGATGSVFLGVVAVHPDTATMSTVAAARRARRVSTSFSKRAAAETERPVEPPH